MKCNKSATFSTKLLASGVIAVCCFLPACSNYDPVAVSQCGDVVKHAKKVLAKFAPSHSDMMKDCKKASDQERGCIMAATKKGQIVQCG